MSPHDDFFHARQIGLALERVESLFVRLFSKQRTAPGFPGAAMNRSSNGKRLKGHARIQLNDAAGQRHAQERAVGAGRWRDRCADRPQGAAGHVVARQIEVGMVEHVKEVGSQRKLEPLGYVEVLRQIEVGVEESWAAQHVA